MSDDQCEAVRNGLRCKLGVGHGGNHAAIEVLHRRVSWGNGWAHLDRPTAALSAKEERR